MSIKGIDAQIMVTRTADIMRENIAVQKKPEVTQNYLAVQAKANEAHDQKRVSRKTEVEMPKLRTEDGGGGSGGAAGGSHSKRGKDGRDGRFEDEALVPAEDHVIDIKV